MKYPSVVFIDENLQVIQSIPGFRTPFELELFMLYFAEDNHQKQPWSRFKKQQSLFKKNTLHLPISRH